MNLPGKMGEKKSTKVRKLTNAEEEQGLHAEVFLLRELHQHKLLRQVFHSDAVLVHGGDLHPMPARGKKSAG